MEERDVIVSAFARPGNPRQIELDGDKIELASFAQPLEHFDQEPLLLTVEAPLEAGEILADKAFSRAVARLRDENGSILTRFFRSRLRGVKIRRVALVGFSAGGGFLRSVLASPDAEWVDTAIFLDAIHLSKPYPGAPNFLPQSLGPLVNYGVRAANAPTFFDGPLMVQTHTHIATPHESVGSTSESAKAISASVKANTPNAARSGFDMSLIDGPPPPAITIGYGVPPPKKTFDQVPEPTGVTRGNYFALDFGGTVGADHVFQAWFVQPGVFRALLAPRWNAPAVCPTGDIDTESCGVRGVVVPNGVFVVPDSPAYGAAAAGFAIGTLTGLALARAFG